METLPPQVREHLDHDDDAEASLRLVKCRGCKSIADHCESVEIVLGEKSHLISLSCSSACAAGTWYVCCVCKQSFPRWAKAETHMGTKKHKLNVGKKNTAPVDIDISDADHLTAFDNSQSNFYPLADSQDSTLSYSLEVEFGNTAEATVLDCDDCSITATAASVTTKVPVESEEGLNSALVDVVANNNNNPHYYNSPLHGRHEWLAELLKDTRKATASQVFDSLACSPNMQRFWQAEHNSPGGGLIYLVGRAFNRSNFVGVHNLPDLPEAEWQMQNFMQYVSMSEKQRKWHAQITMKITSSGSELIKKTRVPNPQELKKFYMADCQHSLWQALPVPRIQNFGGIAYVNPVDIIRFAFACGLEFDDIPVSKDTKTDNFTGKQYHVAHSQILRNLVKQLKEAQGENDDYRLAVAWCTDWRDGFGVNRTKNNRKSVVAWTFSVSPGKDVVNSVGNTFAMALGQKKNDAWFQVEHQVRKDTSILGDAKNPLELYHGGLRKMVRVFVARVNTSHDKPERADITGTVNFNSNMHRSFGRLVHIVTPPCASKNVQQFLDEANPKQSNSLANGLEWGWSNRMVGDKMDDDPDSRANGAILPSCLLCRAKNLHAVLFKSFPNKYISNISPDEVALNLSDCPVCADWTMDASTAHKLPFKSPEDYPTTFAPNCPVEPPPDPLLRMEKCPKSGETNKYMHLVELEFPNMVKACKVAFFNLVSEKPWTVAMGKAYLTANGIAPKHGTQLCSVAKEAKKKGRANNVDYYDPERIDEFEFLAAWIDPNMKREQYIETLMHELALGVAEGNFELCSFWNKSKNRDTAFRRSAQELLLELKKFGLNWLHAYPFNAGDGEGNYGTGSWQGENWIAWIRISKIVYLQVTLPHTDKNPKTTGNWDVLRLVISFTGLAARAMSHSGINESDIQEFECYLKEFLSCVRELDIQTRHKEMQKKVKKVLDQQEASQFCNVSVPTGKQAGKTGQRDSKASSSEAATKKKRSTRKEPILAVTSGPVVHGKRKRKKNAGSESDSDYNEETSGQESAVPANTKAPARKRAKKSSPTDTVGKENRKNQTSKKNHQSKEKKKRNESNDGNKEAFWMRSNYLSLPNLVRMMELFGLLINFWDGGGKGEKFVQEVKPLISRGVHDYQTFFVVVMEKLYKHRLLDIFREMYSLFVPSPKGSNVDSEESSQSRFTIGPDGEIVIKDRENTSSSVDLLDDLLADPDYSPMEDRNMSKLKTIYSYRSLQQLERALDDKKPISGILVESEDDGTKMEFYVIHKVKKEKDEEAPTHAWTKIDFDDTVGVQVGGLWYAPIKRINATHVKSTDFKAIQQAAKMSTVAIPMSYGIGPGKLHSDMYTVLTNWWKERQQNGRYTLPGLDPAYYTREDNYLSMEDNFKPKSCTTASRYII